MRYLIIGSGAAGISAAEAIRSKDREGEILLVSNEKEGYYSRPGLAYYLTKEIGKNALFPFTEKDFRRMGIRRVQGHVEKIVGEGHYAEFKGGKQIGYDKALIAVGASAVMPTLPGLELEGVVKLDQMQDADKMIKRSRKTRDAVVVGGGITALEIVEGLRERGVRVHFFLRRDRYWGNVLDEAESRIIEQRLRHEGVRIYYGTEVEEILGKGGKVTGVRTTAGKTIKCQMAAFAIGVRPQLGLAQASGIETGRGVMVNEYMQTNMEDVYAAGDAAEVFDRFSGKTVVESLWTPARQQGHVAGLNMAGEKFRYQRTTPYNVTRLAGLTTTIIGTVGNVQEESGIRVVRGESETWHTIPDAIVCQYNFDVNRLRIMVGEKKLVGALIMGNQTLSQPLQTLIAKEVDISPIRDKLLNSEDVPIVDTLTQFWTQWSRQYAG